MLSNLVYDLTFSLIIHVCVLFSLRKKYSTSIRNVNTKIKYQTEIRSSNASNIKPSSLIPGPIQTFKIQKAFLAKLLKKKIIERILLIGNMLK